MTDESEKSQSLDLLGVKPIAVAISTVTSATVAAVGAFLSRICLPAAEEFGLLLKDRVHSWRSANIAAIAMRAEQNLKHSDPDSNSHAHPRLVAGILEEGSWTEDPIVQDLWAGLLSASCTEDGDDDSNLIFVNILADLTKLQARILNYICETATKCTGPNGLPYCDTLTVPLDKLIAITDEKDIHRLDREMDNLRDLGLLTVDTGFALETSSTDAILTPSPLALHMYVRCQGSRCSPVEFFDISVVYQSDAVSQEDASKQIVEP